MAVALEKNNKIYPKDVRKFLMGLYATLHLTDNATAKDMEKVVYYAFRNGEHLIVLETGEDFIGYPVLETDKGDPFFLVILEADDVSLKHLRPERRPVALLFLLAV